jgi:hypothetical protein
MFLREDLCHARYMQENCFLFQVNLAVRISQQTIRIEGKQKMPKNHKIFRHFLFLPNSNYASHFVFLPVLHDYKRTNNRGCYPFGKQCKYNST